MAEYRHNAVVTGGGILATVGAAVIIGWWTIPATAAGFWQWWLVAPAFVAVLGAVMIVGVALDWYPSLLHPRRNSRGQTPTTAPPPSEHPPDPLHAAARSTRRATEERVEVDVTPEYLTGFFKDHMDVQAQKLAAPFIGKWMTVSGPLGNVGAWRGTYSQVTFNRPGVDVPAIYMIFRDEAQVDRLSVLKHGDRMTVCGRIDELDCVRVQLDPCELIEVVLTPLREQLVAARAEGAAIRDQTVDADDKAQVSEWETRHEAWKTQTYDWLRRDVDAGDAFFFTDMPEITETARANLSGRRLIETFGSVHNCRSRLARP